MSEFANANFDLYMEVAQRTLPNLGRLHWRYQNHNLDAGLCLDREFKDFFNPDRYNYMVINTRMGTVRSSRPRKTLSIC